MTRVEPTTEGNGHDPDGMRTAASSRRRFLIGGAASVSSAGLGALAGVQLTQTEAAAGEPKAAAPEIVEFDGVHQAGIATPGQSHVTFVAFDLQQGVTSAMVGQLLRSWSALGRALASGDTDADTTAISHGSEPALFTLTVGVGGSLLDRLGIERPPGLVDLPSFPGDRLDEGDSHGDLFLQIASNDALHVAAAHRALGRIGAGIVQTRWQMTGFRGAAASTSISNGRNLMGQIDGTNNSAVSQQSLGGPVWIEESRPAWLNGGTYAVIRRFQMLLDDWESAPPTSRDEAIGRHLATGAPLGASAESDPVDLEAVHADGTTVIPLGAHIRLAAPTPGADEEMLRRSYSYMNDSDDAGLIFVSYQKDPRTSFIPVQQRLAEKDLLNRFVVATSSALFLILPGTGDPRGWIGQSLFGD